MQRILKYAAVAGTAGMMAIGMSMPSYAAHGRNAAAAIGFGAGAVVGAAAANANNGYYGPRYSEPGYAYSPGYGSSPGYGAYDYAPGPRAGYAVGYDNYGPSALTTSERQCTLSPASINYVPCLNQD